MPLHGGSGSEDAATARDGNCDDDRACASRPILNCFCSVPRLENDFFPLSRDPRRASFRRCFRNATRLSPCHVRGSAWTGFGGIRWTEAKTQVNPYRGPTRHRNSTYTCSIGVVFCVSKPLFVISHFFDHRRWRRRESHFRRRTAETTPCRFVHVRTGRLPANGHTATS